MYLQIARHTLWLLTLVHLVLVFGFHQPPPVAGCGPVHSFPSSQTTLSSYALGVFWFYQVCARRGRSDSLPQKQFEPTPPNSSLRAVMIAQLAAVQYSVLWLGMASPPACVAGTVVGIGVACVLHRGLKRVYSLDPGVIEELTAAFFCVHVSPPAPATTGLVHNEGHGGTVR